MAIDEVILDKVANNGSQNALRFYKWNPSTASIGQHQSLSAEIDSEAANEHNVNVVRRISGGGAVFHDHDGEITYAVVCHEKDLPRNLISCREYDASIPYRYQIVLEALAHGLESVGIPVDAGKIHCPALLTAGKKISGNAQAIRKNVVLQHGTILLTVNPELMYQILKAPVGTDYTKMVKSVRSKVTGILQEDFSTANDSVALSEDQIINALKHGFEDIFQIEFEEQPLSDLERTKVQDLVAQKYANPIWLLKYP
jgi:lipoate-protein ligase A